MSRYFLRFSFKGTRYAGWQIQDNALAVQEVLNDALKTLLKHETNTTGCGRTDTGVHAKQFYAHFDSNSELGDPVTFIYRLNAILPDDIVIHELVKVADNAHARYDAFSRTYEYFISTSKDPFLKEFVMVSYGSYDIQKMKLACSYLVAQRDYSSFSKTRTQVKTNVCHITEAFWELKGQMLVFTITSDRFLRGMVRAIVGTMLEVGMGKMEPENLISIIESKNRSEAGVSVPANGLYLVQIRYPFLEKVQSLKFPI